MDGEGREVLLVQVNPPADFEVRKRDILERLTGLTPKDLMLPSAVPLRYMMWCDRRFKGDPGGSRHTE